MKLKRKIIFVLTTILLFSNTIPLLAENKTKDSIGSMNMEDDGSTIGIDETQQEKTTYFTE